MMAMTASLEDTFNQVQNRLNELERNIISAIETQKKDEL
jgi:hypothetical protein